jgi:hypothetical protein
MRERMPILRRAYKTAASTEAGVTPDSAQAAIVQLL